MNGKILKIIISSYGMPIPIKPTFGEKDKGAGEGERGVRGQEQKLRVLCSQRN